uniref:Uncharacterized protein n=1 Tax=Oryza glumipatula TaxID=40148 RepID=A0A0E0BF59_9ORYZ
MVDHLSCCRIQRVLLMLPGAYSLWSQFLARFAANLPGILLSMRQDFLWSLHLFSPSAFLLSSYLQESFHMLMYIYKLNHTQTPL